MNPSRQTMEIGAVAVLGIIAALIIWALMRQDGSEGSSAPAPVTVTERPESKWESPTDYPSPSTDYLDNGTLTGQGMYLAGTDIPAGRYTTEGPQSADPLNSCYWARLKDDSGTFESVITNGMPVGKSSVSVNAGEFVEFTGSCEWRLAR